MTDVTVRRFRHLIVEHFDSTNRDIVCRRGRTGFSLHRAHDHRPLAKLRPTGCLDEVEIERWDGGQWKSVSESGSALPLRECLEYLTDDPERLFFDDDDDEPSDIRFSAMSSERSSAVHSFHGHIFLCAIGGGVVGGVFSGAVTGGLWGSLAALLCCACLVAMRKKVRTFLPQLLFLGGPILFLAGAGGVLGGGANDFISHGIWGPICGCVVGGVASVLIYSGIWMSQGIGFMVGLTLAASLIEMTQWRGEFIGLALVAIIASLSAVLYAGMARSYAKLMTRLLAQRCDVA